MELGLNGKNVLVTAASKGIGFAVARRLSAEGARVAMNSRNGDTLLRAVAALDSSPGTVFAYPADLLDEAATEAMFRAVEAAQGPLEVVILNTPGPPIKSFIDTTAADWTSAYQSLLRPCIQLAKLAAQSMAPQGRGVIIFLTSTWVKQPSPGGVLSAVMRSAVSALSKQMALELGPRGVRVNQIQPGATATDRMKAIVETKANLGRTTQEQVIKEVVAQIPLGRWAEPEEIADVVAFMASERSKFVTGVALQVDGGAVRSTV